MDGLEAPILELIKIHRDAIERGSKEVLALKKHSVFNEASPAPENADIGEMLANIMLAYRHLEDARMRLGKVIQAHDGGESIYDKKCGNCPTDKMCEKCENPVNKSRN